MNALQRVIFEKVAAKVEQAYVRVDRMNKVAEMRKIASGYVAKMGEAEKSEFIPDYLIGLGRAEGFEMGKQAGLQEAWAHYVPSFLRKVAIYAGEEAAESVDEGLGGEVDAVQAVHQVAQEAAIKKLVEDMGEEAQNPEAQQVIQELSEEIADEVVQEIVSENPEMGDVQDDGQQIQGM